jgi:hypothetical protein
MPSPVLTASGYAAAGWHDALMDVRAEITYPTGSPDEVFALAVDKGFREAVCEATHALDHVVEIDHQPDGRVRVRVERTLPADVPDFVRSFVGNTITVVQAENWAPSSGDGVRTADVLIQIKGQPASMAGSETLQRDGSGTRQLITGDLTVSVPFFGKKIEAEVAKAILAAAAKEQETGRIWLSRPR